MYFPFLYFSWKGGGCFKQFVEDILPEMSARSWHFRNYTDRWIRLCHNAKSNQILRPRGTFYRRVRRGQNFVFLLEGGKTCVA